MRNHRHSKSRTHSGIGCGLRVSNRKLIRQGGVFSDGDEQSGKQRCPLTPCPTCRLRRAVGHKLRCARSFSLLPGIAIWTSFSAWRISHRGNGRRSEARSCYFCCVAAVLCCLCVPLTQKAKRIRTNMHMMPCLTPRRRKSILDRCSSAGRLQQLQDIRGGDRLRCHTTIRTAIESW